MVFINTVENYNYDFFLNIIINFLNKSKCQNYKLYVLHKSKLYEYEINTINIS